MATFPTLERSPSDFPMPTLEQGSPFGGVLANAIAKRLAMAKAQTAEAEVPYAGLSKLAQILSQSAYANAVTPQFQAKLLGVPGAIANLKNPQTTLNNLASYGATGSTGNVLQNHINKELLKIANNSNKSDGGFLDKIGLGKIGQGIKDLFLGNDQEQVNSNATNDQNYNTTVSGQTQNMPMVQNTTSTTPSNVVQNPTGRSQESLAYSTNQASHNRQTNKGLSEGTKQGEQQAEYGESAQAIVDQQKSLKTLKNIFNNPEIQKIADVPFASQHSINWYKQTGTQAQKRALGELETGMKLFVSSSLKMFGSRATDLDVKFLNSMKPAENDTMDVRKGKWISANAYVESKAQQIQLADQYMDQGMSKAQAEFKAAKEVNMDAIRDQAYRDIEPQKEGVRPEHITVENLQHTAKQLGISVPDVIARLKKKGIEIPEGEIRAY